MTGFPPIINFLADGVVETKFVVNNVIIKIGIS
jgi:hypothetical protein